MGGGAGPHTPPPGARVYNPDEPENVQTARHTPADTAPHAAADNNHPTPPKAEGAAVHSNAVAGGLSSQALEAIRDAAAHKATPPKDALFAGSGGGTQKDTNGAVVAAVEKVDEDIKKGFDRQGEQLRKLAHGVPHDETGEQRRHIETTVNLSPDQLNTITQVRPTKPSSPLAAAPASAPGSGLVGSVSDVPHNPITDEDRARRAAPPTQPATGPAAESPRVAQNAEPRPAAPQQQTPPPTPPPALSRTAQDSTPQPDASQQPTSPPIEPSRQQPEERPTGPSLPTSDDKTNGPAKDITRPGLERSNNDNEKGSDRKAA